MCILKGGRPEPTSEITLTIPKFVTILHSLSPMPMVCHLAAAMSRLHMVMNAQQSPLSLSPLTLSPLLTRELTPLLLLQPFAPSAQAQMDGLVMTTLPVPQMPWEIPWTRMALQDVTPPVTLTVWMLKA